MPVVRVLHPPLHEVSTQQRYQPERNINYRVVVCEVKCEEAEPEDSSQ